MEISWDNEAHPPTRPDLQFVHDTGSIAVPAELVAREAKQLCVDLADAISGKADSPGLLNRAKALRASVDDWRYLVPRSMSRLLESPAFDSVRKEMERAAESADGILVEHRLASLLLCSVEAATEQHVKTLLAILASANRLSAPANLPVVQRYAPAPSSRPWEAGYEAALALRDELGWADMPAPTDIRSWLSARGIGVEESSLHPGIDGAAIRSGAGGALIHLNAASHVRDAWTPNMRLMTQLGHILLDAPSGRPYAIVEGAWTHWPTSARARAFAAMVLMPEEGVRRLAGSREIDAGTVRGIMSHFGTGLQATSWHLKNMKLISDEKRTELIEQVASAPERTRGSECT